MRDERTVPTERATVANSEPPPRGWRRPVALLLAIAAIFVLARAFGLTGRLGDLRAWIQSLGPWGPAVFVLIYVGAAAAAIPGSALTIAAGALFGSVRGVVIVSIGATLGASVAFLISRYFAREAVAGWLSKSDRFRRLDELTEEQGAIIVALTRLVPLFPYSLLNYAFGLTRVRFWTYLFWSWLCMLPATVLYVAGADAAARGLTEGRVPWPLIAGVAAVAVLLAALVAYARRKLQESVKEASTQRRQDAKTRR